MVRMPGSNGMFFAYLAAILVACGAWWFVSPPESKMYVAGECGFILVVFILVYGAIVAFRK